MRSIQEDGTTENPSGSGIGSEEYPEDVWTFLAGFGTLGVFAFAVVPEFVDDGPERIATAGITEFPLETVAIGAAAFPFESPETPEGASVSGSGNAGEKEIRSEEYPENDVVRASGKVGNQDEAVRREAAERFLMRNSEDVDESIRKDVFTSVVPLNHNRRTDHDIVAVEKNPVAVATLAA